MSEAELHLMQQRLRQGLLAKARRGELALLPPLGYVRRADGALVLDPDEQVQQVVRLVFRTFAELGTVRTLLAWLTITEALAVIPAFSLWSTLSRTRVT